MAPPRPNSSIELERSRGRRIDHARKRLSSRACRRRKKKCRRPWSGDALMAAQFADGRFSLATLATAANASGSLKARNAKTLRSSSTSAFFKAPMNLL